MRSLKTSLTNLCRHHRVTGDGKSLLTHRMGFACGTSQLRWRAAHNARLEATPVNLRKVDWMRINNPHHQFIVHCGTRPQCSTPPGHIRWQGARRADVRCGLARKGDGCALNGEKTQLATSSTNEVTQFGPTQGRSHFNEWNLRMAPNQLNQDDVSPATPYNRGRCPVSRICETRQRSRFFSRAMTKVFTTFFGRSSCGCHKFSRR